MNETELGQASTCYCGKQGCIETWLSGPGIAWHAGPAFAGQSAAAIAAQAEAGDPAAQAVIEQVADRLARALASIINVFDPDCIVLGGGVSNIQALYRLLPELLPRYVFSDYCDTPVLPNRHGDASGVRGAAWLWPV
jgi:N-acetylglucosamine kinase (EC 2.7.1.59)